MEHGREIVNGYSISIVFIQMSPELSHEWAIPTENIH